MFKFFGYKPDSITEKVFQLSATELTNIELHNKLQTSGKFEFLIYCAFCILQSNDYSPEVKSKYLRHLVNIRKDYGVNLSSGATVDFVNSRMRFYSTELKKIFNSNNYLNGNIYHVFYESPLTITPRQSDNLPEIIKFSSYFMTITKRGAF